VRISSGCSAGTPDAKNAGIYETWRVNHIDTENFLLLLRRKNFITKELAWRLKNLHLT
jgi:hypothetical protein